MLNGHGAEVAVVVGGGEGAGHVLIIIIHHNDNNNNNIYIQWTTECEFIHAYIIIIM